MSRALRDARDARRLPRASLGAAHSAYVMVGSHASRPRSRRAAGRHPRPPAASRARRRFDLDFFTEDAEAGRASRAAAWRTPSSAR